MGRLFFAIETPGQIRQKLREAQQHLLEVFDPKVLKLEHLENSHLTLAFLGEVDERVVQPLVAAATSAIAKADIPPFEMSATDVLPNDKRRPKVIWVAVEPGAPLASLHQGLVEASTTAGIPLEVRHFHPHLTLARFRQPVKLELTTFPRLSDVSAAVNDLVLIESVLGYGAPKHTVIARFPLKPRHVD